MNSPRYARVAVLRPIRSSFEYSIPEEKKNIVVRGSICVVPFRGKEQRGVVLETTDEPEYRGEKEELKRVVTEKPLKKNLLDLANWLSFATFTPLGQVFNRFLPADLSVRPRTREKVELALPFARVSSFIEREEKRKPKQAELLQCLLASDEPLKKQELLTRADSSRSPLKALKREGFVKESSVAEIEGRKYDPPDVVSYRERTDRPIDGVAQLSGSFGKYVTYGPMRDRIATYLAVIRRLTGTGKVILLAPNVIRAEELAGLIRKELDLTVASYHSELTRGEISRRWNLAHTGGVDLFVGVLNAIYLPIERLGGIIVEGDGDRNYTLNDQDPKGNLIETAFRRAELEKVPVLVAGPAPSLSSYHGVKKKNYVELNEPGFEWLETAGITLSRRGEKSEGETLSPGLRDRIKENFRGEGLSLIIGEQTSSSGAAFCKNCGDVLRCAECQVPISYTSSGNYGVCPYCGERESLLICPNCGSDEIKFIGGGLEKAKSEIEGFLPRANVRRFDSGKESWEDFITVAEKALSGEIDVLLGTSVTASLYFCRGVSLVGLLDTNFILNRPSYRSTELVFQRILTGLDLVAPEGEVVVQTYGSQDDAISTILTTDWEKIYEKELKSRKEMGYPPFKNLVTIQLEGKEGEIRDEASRLKKQLVSGGGNFIVLGPTSSGKERKRQVNLEMMVKAEDLEGFLDRMHGITEGSELEDLRLNPFS